MKRVLTLFGCCCLTAIGSGSFAASETASADASSVLKRAGVQRGIAVVLGDKPVSLAAELARASELLIYVQVPTERVEAERELADQKGLLGKRVVVEEGSLSHLHLADNLADVVVAPSGLDGSGGATTQEVLRILRPGGKAILGSKEMTKPFPEGTDDWSHPYHGPDNNPQSKDQLARAPFLTHFLAEPWYSPMPLVTVASGGRLFKAFGHIAIKEREWPLLNKLVAQNAFNGAILWQRDLSSNFMIHRCTLIATPQTLFVADDKSCKLLDAATGDLRDEIVSGPEDGRVWKWMALADGVLYALVGKDETPDPIVRGERRARGWPWGPPLGVGYNSKQYPWGFGQTILAIDLASKKVLWRHRESEPLDTRAMCMAGGRIFFYSHPKFLGALKAASGDVLWRTSDTDVLQAIGEHRFAQNPGEGFSTSSYVKASDKALYFAGPTRTDLAAVSAADGKLLWRQTKAGNSQLVLRNDGLYALGPSRSARYDYLTGEVLESIGPRVNCTRATGSLDSIFVRGGRDGTMRYDLTDHRRQHICAMRPSCQDGVLVAHGHLFWGPWMCDCNLTLVGVVSVAPAGEFSRTVKAGAVGRLETFSNPQPSVSVDVGSADWPTLRATNSRTAVSSAAVPGKVRMRWTVPPRSGLPATAPTAAGKLAFVGGLDGAVRAFDSGSGDLRWTAFTGGPISYPPAIWNDRAFVGSGDGWIYCFEAATGRKLWRFRAAPADRFIPVYGTLRSTWPVASGVLVQDGVAYAAAGLANYDGTYLFALDAKTGSMLWNNSNSGQLDPETAGGVSVNGHLLLHGKRLYLAGGNMAPVASYSSEDGKCLTDPSAPKSHTQFTAGSDLFLVSDQVRSGGTALYSAQGDYRMVNEAVLQTPAGDLVIAYGPHDGSLTMYGVGASQARSEKPHWKTQPLNRILGIAATAKTIVVAGLRDAPKPAQAPEGHVLALKVQDGSLLWSQPVTAAPVPWGVAVDRDGRVLVSLQDGGLVCFGSTD